MYLFTNDIKTLTMEVSNIYGPISNNTEVVLAIGNYNNIHGLLTYISNSNILQMNPLADIISPMILELIVNYSSDSSNTLNNKFTLAIKGTDKFIGVEDARLISKIGEAPQIRNVTTCISSTKTYFTLDFSVVDRLPRNKILSGVLYSLRTIIGEQQYTVTWRIKDFANGDLMIFLPTTWYERHEKFNDTNTCQRFSETPILLDKLNQLRFRGYTNAKWCEQLPTLTHCTADSNCGKCLGNCHHSDHICYPDSNGNFICSSPNDVVDILQVTSGTNTVSTTTRTIATWIVLGAILIIILLLVWGLSRK